MIESPREELDAATGCYNGCLLIFGMVWILTLAAWAIVSCG